MPKEPIYIKCESEIGNLSPCLCAAKKFDDRANRDVVDYYDDNCPHRYKAALQSSIKSAIEVSNQEELARKLKISGTFSLECSVEMKNFCASDICDTDGQCEHCREPKQLALVTFESVHLPILHGKVNELPDFESVEKQTQEEQEMQHKCIHCNGTGYSTKPPLGQ